MEEFKEHFDEDNWWAKLKRYASNMGISTVYSALLMYYAYKRKETPAWAKRIVIGSLGYLIAPIDLLPDLTPIIGYTDDLGILGFGAVAIAAYINKEVRTEARAKLKIWFGEYDEDELDAVDEKL